MAVLRVQHLAQSSDASSVLLHRADGNADPFRQVIAFHRAHDDFALEQSAKNREAVADIDENEIRRAGYKWEPHCSKFFFEIGAPLVGQLFRLALMFFIGQRSQCADLADAIDVKRLSRFLEHLDQFRPGDPVADAYTRESMNFGERPQRDNTSTFVDVT